MNARKEKLFPDYVTKPNSNRKKNCSFNDSKWRKQHYLPVKKTISIIKRNNF